MQTNITVTGIRWDADTAEELEGVSTTVQFSIPTTEFKEFIANEDEEGWEELISDKISDISGFCHDGWEEHTVTD
jgi:hypothetical protein